MCVWGPGFKHHYCFLLLFVCFLSGYQDISIYIRETSKPVQWAKQLIALSSVPKRSVIENWLLKVAPSDLHTCTMAAPTSILSLTHNNNKIMKNCMWLTTYFHWLILLLKNLDMIVPKETWARILTASFLLPYGQRAEQMLPNTETLWDPVQMSEHPCVSKASGGWLQNSYTHTRLHILKVHAVSQEYEVSEIQTAVSTTPHPIPASCFKRKRERWSRLHLCLEFFLILFIAYPTGSHGAQASLKFLR